MQEDLPLFVHFRSPALLVTLALAGCTLVVAAPTAPDKTTAPGSKPTPRVIETTRSAMESPPVAPTAVPTVLQTQDPNALPPNPNQTPTVGTSRMPHLTWVGVDPKLGLSVGVKSTRTVDPSGEVTVATQLDYKNGTDVTFMFSAPPDSPPVLIKAYDLLHTYRAPIEQTAGLPPRTIGPVRVDIPLLRVEPGQSAQLVVPVAIRALQDVWGAESGEQPGIVNAQVELLGEDGQSIVDQNEKPLVMTVPIRAL